MTSSFCSGFKFYCTRLAKDDTGSHSLRVNRRKNKMITVSRCSLSPNFFILLTMILCQLLLNARYNWELVVTELVINGTRCNTKVSGKTVIATKGPMPYNSFLLFKLTLEDLGFSRGECQPIPLVIFSWKLHEFLKIWTERGVRH